LTNNGGCGDSTCKNTIGSFICTEKSENNQVDRVGIGVGVGVTFGLLTLLFLVLLILFFLKKNVFYLFSFILSFFF